MPQFNRGKLLYDDSLAEMCRGTPSHSFLLNPASQYCHLYLMQFLRDFSVQELCQLPDNVRVLDWGCGKGQCSYLLRKMGLKVTACDIYRDSEDSSFGQPTPIIDRTGIKVVPLTNDVNLPFAGGSFDVVLSMGVLEHVKDHAASLREIYRVLVPGGLFFCFYLPFHGSWIQFVARYRGRRYHDRLYTKRRVEDLLARAGFRMIDFWHRQLLPKNNVRYPFPMVFERLDRALVRFTPLRYFATNIEFIARRF